jgi:hypothetical protein
MTSNTETAILERVLDPNKDDMSPEMVRYILGMDFPPADVARMDELAEKARDGTLSAPEQFEIEEYRRVADLLALLQSKARRSLKKLGTPA